MTLLRCNVPSIANLAVICRERRVVWVLLEPHCVQSCVFACESSFAKATIIRIFVLFFELLQKRKDTFNYQKTFPSSTDGQIKLNIPLHLCIHLPLCLFHFQCFELRRYLYSHLHVKHSNPPIGQSIALTITPLP